MKTITKEFKVYDYSDVIKNEELKGRVLEKMSDVNIFEEWWDFCFEDFKEIAKLIGIDIKNIYFSGFYSQGNGACFEGYYSYAKQSIKNLKAFCPNETEVFKIAEGLQAIQKKHLYSLSASVKHSGHYYHSGCTEIQVYKNDSYEDIQEIDELLRDFMDWMYSKLRKEYEYLTSEESILETIEINEYKFNENGDIF